MPALADRKYLRLLTLCLLYLAQGMPWGFVTYTLAAYFAGQGMEAKDLGAALAITSLPWSIKFLWGPLVDRFTAPAFGRRRPWIVMAQALMVITIFGILAVPDLVADLKILVALLFVHNVFAALQDVAVDALAVDLLDEEERGTANGLMYGCKYLGGGIGGAGLSRIMETVSASGGSEAGLQAAIATQGLILAAILLFPLLLRERSTDRLVPFGAPGRSDAAPAAGPDLGEAVLPHVPQPEAPRDMMETVRTLFRVFRLRSPFLGALFALGMSISAGALGVIATIFYVQHLGWADTEYAQFAGGPALVMGLVGAFAGGWLADKLGRKTVIIGSCFALAALWVAFVLCQPYWEVKMVVKGFLLAEPLFMSMMAGGFFALCMDLSLPAVAATQFTAYMALSNLSASMGQYFGGVLKDSFSYPQLFLAAAVVQVVVAGYVALIDPLEARRVLGDGE